MKRWNLKVSECSPTIKITEKESMPEESSLSESQARSALVII